MANKKTIINAPLATQTPEDDFEIVVAEDIKGTFPITNNASTYLSGKTHRGARGTVIFETKDYDTYPSKFPNLLMTDKGDGITSLYTFSPIPDDSADTSATGMIAVWNKYTRAWEGKVIEGIAYPIVSGGYVNLSNFTSRVFYFANAADNSVAVPDGTVINFTGGNPVNDCVFTITLPKLATAGSVTLVSPTHPIHILNGAFSTSLRNVIMVHVVKVSDTIYHLHTVIRNY